ncbi:hypothetical protein R3Q15_20635, partial [Gordonia amicalis]|nr:hypothetical protein [Gordonia amicalis]
QSRTRPHRTQRRLTRRPRTQPGGSVHLAVDTLGAPTTPAEAIASITEALATLRDTLRAAEEHQAAAKRHAARLYLDR